MSDATAGKSVSQLSALLQAGVLDPQTLVEQTFDAIRTYPDQAIFVSLSEARPRQRPPPPRVASAKVARSACSTAYLLPGRICLPSKALQPLLAQSC